MISQKTTLIIATAAVLLILTASVYFRFSYKHCWNCETNDYLKRGFEYVSEKDRGYQQLGLEHLKTAARQGSEKAKIFLGEIYMDNLPEKYVSTFQYKPADLRAWITPDRENALQYFKDVNLENVVDPKLQYNLSVLYGDGILNTPNAKDKARTLLSQSAQSGNKLAMFELGMFYHKSRNYSEALQWFNKVYQANGNPATALIIGDCYFYGKGVTTDNQEAIKWYMAAQKGPDKDVSVKAKGRLSIARKRSIATLSGKAMPIKYSVVGSPRIYVVSVIEDSEVPIGRVTRENSKILARIEEGLFPETIPTTNEVSSMNEGLFWILSEYANNKYGNDKTYNFNLKK